MKKRLAILGATGHVGKSIVCWALMDGQYDLFLFARSTERAEAFLATIGVHDGIPVKSFEAFPSGEYDAVVNCVGIGSPQKLMNQWGSIFAITERFDALVLAYLEAHPETKYINISSGAVYGTDFQKAVDGESVARFPINRLTPADYYGIAKLNAEAKHRALASRSIVDVRMFAYFSRFMAIEERFLLSEIITAIQSRQLLRTGPDDIVRDYVHPFDLMSMIGLIVHGEPLNGAFDLYSSQPTTKFELLHWFAEHHGLRFAVDESYQAVAATGVKSNYFSENKQAETIGYRPRYSSREAVALEAEALLSAG